MPKPHEPSIILRQVYDRLPTSFVLSVKQQDGTYVEVQLTSQQAKQIAQNLISRLL